MHHRYIHTAVEVMDVLDVLPFDRLVFALKFHYAEDLLDGVIVWC